MGELLWQRGLSRSETGLKRTTRLAVSYLSPNILQRFVPIHLNPPGFRPIVIPIVMTSYTILTLDFLKDAASQRTPTQFFKGEALPSVGSVG